MYKKCAYWELWFHYKGLLMKLSVLCLMSVVTVWKVVGTDFRKVGDEMGNAKQGCC